MLKPQRFFCSEPSSISLLLASICHSPPSATVPSAISATPFTSVWCHSSARTFSVSCFTGSRTMRISICFIVPYSFFSFAIHPFSHDVLCVKLLELCIACFYTKSFRGGCRRQMRLCCALLLMRLCRERPAGGAGLRQRQRAPA